MMAKMQFDVEKIKNVEGQLSQTLTDKAHELDALPLECKYECHVSIGADGKPVITCGIVC
jgi:hypothetical protein